MTPETCPKCGTDVPPRARACPECGADENTGWSDQAHADSIGLPDDSFDYGEYVQREFGGGSKRDAAKARARNLWRVVAALLVLGMVWLIFRGWFGR
jgi:hypothetical protein